MQTLRVKKKLKNCLIDSMEYSSRYYELFRLLMQSTDVVNRYMFLYQILLDMHGSQQCKVDKYIISCSKESIFTGLNNLGIISIIDKLSDEYFSFTLDEVKKS